MSETASKSKAKSGWLNLLLDFGPVIAFFVVHRVYSPSSGQSDPVAEIQALLKATGAFMVASVAAVILSKWKLGKVSPMLWFTTALVIGFGGITIYTQDQAWLRHKPTAIYLLFSAILWIGLARGQALLRYLLDAAFEGLSDRGWRILSRNWAIFFLFLAGLNEILCLKRGGDYIVSLETWIAAKIWLFMPLSFLFTFTQLPMLLRHGLLQDAEGEVLSDPPHE